MKISEHANYLLNEFGRLQFDYAAYCKPYGESLRNEARNNLETYIAELETFVGKLIEVGHKSVNFVEGFCNTYGNERPKYWHDWKALEDDWKERER